MPTQQDTKAGKPALTDALETVRQKLGKIDNVSYSETRDS